jgi:hypothetical protein
MYMDGDEDPEAFQITGKIILYSGQLKESWPALWHPNTLIW